MFGRNGRREGGVICFVNGVFVFFLITLSLIFNFYLGESGRRDY